LLRKSEMRRTVRRGRRQWTCSLWVLWSKVEPIWPHRWLYEVSRVWKVVSRIVFWRPKTKAFHLWSEMPHMWLQLPYFRVIPVTQLCV
jgi:hypothetical protein